MPPKISPPRFTGLVLLLLSVASAHAEDEAPSATPYRPTVSNPADLSAPGYVELEAGGQRVLEEAHTNVNSFPYLVKYAFSENAGLLLGGNAFIRQTDPAGQSLSGVGDTFLLLKLRHTLDDDSALGVEFGPLIPTARNGLGASKTGFLSNGIYSRNFGSLHLDVNAGFNFQSDAPSNASHWQTTWASALSQQFTEHWGAALELSGSYQRNEPSTRQALVAFNCNLSKRIVLDAGFAHDLDHGHSKTLFAGGTFLLGRL